MWEKVRGGVISRHRKADRLAAAREIDRDKTGRCKTAVAAIALLVGFELALAGAERRGAAPVQRLVLELDGAVLAIDGFREAEHLLRRAAHVGMQAFAGLDAIPAAAHHRL